MSAENYVNLNQMSSLKYCKSLKMAPRNNNTKLKLIIIEIKWEYS